MENQFLQSSFCARMRNEASAVLSVKSNCSLRKLLSLSSVIFLHYPFTTVKQGTLSREPKEGRLYVWMLPAWFVWLISPKCFTEKLKYNKSTKYLKLSVFWSLSEVHNKMFSPVCCGKTRTEPNTFQMKCNTDWVPGLTFQHQCPALLMLLRLNGNKSLQPGSKKSNWYRGNEVGNKHIWVSTFGCVEEIDQKRERRREVTESVSYWLSQCVITQ